ncbi:hypothetical protein GCM10010219_52910 [Streptomyces netropsis]|uniref:transposase n=1 Tax=Streptomyces netropsis TaxID=55404 RepID=UPI0019CE3105|nr:hypothetical protein GCM10010219_52910 [Streptomyces netropsis]
MRNWISNLPAGIPPATVVRLAKLRWLIEHDYRELETAMGLDLAEGRSFDGWHRHVILVTAAHLSLAEQRTSLKVQTGVRQDARSVRQRCLGHRTVGSENRGPSRRTPQTLGPLRRHAALTRARPSRGWRVMPDGSHWAVQVVASALSLGFIR